MRRYRGKDGADTLWYDDREIEEIMKVELEKALLYPSPDSPAVEIEMFVEAHLQVAFDQYAELDLDVLGVTEFIAGKRPKIQINRDLTGSALDDDESPLSILGRWRATVAHEASHVILHSALFETNSNQLSLFSLEDDPGPESPRVFRSLKRDVSFCARGGDWREVQANKGMAALLMPKQLFLTVCEREFEQTPFPALRAGVQSPEFRAVAERLAEKFKVSRQAALVRLDTLKVFARHSQELLL